MVSLGAIIADVAVKACFFVGPISPKEHVVLRG